jgi:hypothetical protein
MHLLSEEPTTPHEGDVWMNADGEYVVWQDNEAHVLGVSEEWFILQLAGKADISSTVLNPTYSQTPTFTDWTFSDVSDGITDIQQPVFIPPTEGEPYWKDSFGYDGRTLTAETFVIDEYATNLAFTYSDEGLNLHLTATRTRTDIIGYTLGDQTDKPLASANALSTKQDKLSDPQISAIDSIVDERATIFDFGNGDISALNLVGEITVQKLIDAGIHNEDDTWIKDPVSVKLGTAVTGIDEYTFFTAMYMTNITFPNSVTHIDNSAFEECHALSSITIPESVESVGAYAFNACYNLTSIIVKGKTQAEAETMFAGACVSPSIITTWNDASQEWVKDQNYLSSVPSTYKTYQETVSSLSNDGYATTTYAVKNDGEVAKIKSLTQDEYDALTTVDATTLYVIPEEA